MTMRSAALGQNFLRNRQIAEQLAQLADGPQDALCVDLGAGNGIITEACLRSGRSVLAIEKDSRLVATLRAKFEGEKRVTVVADDLAVTPIPSIPYVIAANPPFNQSTLVVRRWMCTNEFLSAAMITQKPFAHKLAGEYGATKLSIALAPVLSIKVPVELSTTDFRPRPQVPTAVLTVARRKKPPLSRAELLTYWLFVNYLFERSQAIVSDALRALQMPGVPQELWQRPVRDLSGRDALVLFDCVRRGGRTNISALEKFDRGLAEHRRMNLGPSATAGGRPHVARDPHPHKAR